MVQFLQQLNALSGPSAEAAGIPRGKRWVLRRGRKSTQCPGRGGRLSSGGPGVRGLLGTGRLVGTRGLCGCVCRLSAGSALQAVDGVRG